MKYSPEMTKKICDHLEVGVSRDDVIALVSINRDTFYDWMKKSDFSDAVRVSEMKCKAWHIKNIHEAGQKTWQASAWWLERRFQKEYAIKRDEFIDPKDRDRNVVDAAANVLKVMEEAIRANRNPGTGAGSDTSRVASGPLGIQAKGPSNNGV